MIKIQSAQSWSPVQSVLKLSNLPADITPSQIRQILSYVKMDNLSGPLRKVPSGVTIVQIYPSELTTSGKSSKSSRTSLMDPTTQDPIFDGPPVEPHATTSRIPSVSDQDWETPPIVCPVVEDVIHLDTSAALPEIHRSEQTCIAYVHFRSIGYLTQAEKILESVTVNGKLVKVRYKWWTSAPLLRVWAKVGGPK